VSDLRVGWIGLGAMGRPLALHLLRAGHPLAVWARRPEAMQPHVDAGARACGSPAEVANNADVVFTMVMASADSEAVALGAGGIVEGARPGTIVVDMATISPVATRDIAARLEARGSSTSTPRSPAAPLAPRPRRSRSWRAARTRCSRACSRSSSGSERRSSTWAITARGR
jgi:predicted dinucleotide-binding enzyme